MSEETLTFTLTRGDAEVLLGVLTAERYNETVQAICDDLAAQIEDKLNPRQA